ALFDRTTAREGNMLDGLDELVDLALLQDPELAVDDLELGTGRIETREDDPPGMARDFDEPAGPGRDMWPGAQLGDVHRSVAVDLEERQEREVEPAALEVGE